jgi:hypothetical protein
MLKILNLSMSVTHLFIFENKSLENFQQNHFYKNTLFGIDSLMLPNKITCVKLHQMDS